MDLGTIKAKLHSNQYLKFQDFLYDMNLVFENCILYNGENSTVSLMCKGVREEFNKLYYSLFMDYYIWQSFTYGFPLVLPATKVYFS